MKYPIKSIFEQISEKVFTAKTLTEAQQQVIEFVRGKDINDKDKQSILLETSNAKSLVSFQRYISNALLKYEGLGMNNFDKTAREAAAETEFE
jgi:hypothetical protein